LTHDVQYIENVLKGEHARAASADPRWPGGSRTVLVALGVQGARHLEGQVAPSARTGRAGAGCTWHCVP